jgi:mono/diheme cytochrome c family protein
MEEIIVKWRKNRIQTQPMELSMQKLAYTLLLALGVVSIPAQADVASAQKLADKYLAFAKNIDPSAKASIEAGQAFYTRKILVHGKEVSCSSCHTDNPTAVGKHVVTGKPIKPLSPIANTKRFSDLDKVETNFAKHCQDIIGKDCTAQEKANYITFLLSVK